MDRRAFTQSALSTALLGGLPLAQAFGAGTAERLTTITEDVEVIVEQGRFIDTIEAFKFETNIALLDMDGGDRLGKDLTVPGRALLMDSAGRIYIRHEQDDAETVLTHEERFAESKDGRGRDVGNFPEFGGFGGEGAGYIEGFERF